jgi:hypothetical protein
MQTLDADDLARACGGVTTQYGYPSDHRLPDRADVSLLR